MYGLQPKTAEYCHSLVWRTLCNTQNRHVRIFKLLITRHICFPQHSSVLASPCMTWHGMANLELTVAFFPFMTINDNIQSCDFEYSRLSSHFWNTPTAHLLLNIATDEIIMPSGTLSIIIFVSACSSSLVGLMKSRFRAVKSRGRAIITCKIFSVSCRWSKSQFSWRQNWV